MDLRALIVNPEVPADRTFSEAAFDAIKGTYDSFTAEKRARVDGMANEFETLVLSSETFKEASHRVSLWWDLDALMRQR